MNTEIIWVVYKQKDKFKSCLKECWNKYMGKVVFSGNIQDCIKYLNKTKTYE
jgi:hypothetical protein